MIKTLDSYNTSKMAFDPKAKDFVKKLDKYPEFELKTLKEDRSKYLIYIALMYDKNSELTTSIEHTYWQKKKIAAQIAGFKMVNNRFPESVESCLLSNSEDFLIAMIRYLRFQHLPEFTQLCFYRMLHDQLFKQSILDNDTKAMKEASELTGKMAVLEDKICGGQETLKTYELLYEDIDDIDIGSLKPEGIAKELETGSKLEDSSPYPNYPSTGKIKFVGDEKP